MAVENLTDKRIRFAKAKEGNKRGTMFGDGRGLYLHVMPSGTRSWVFRYKLAGKSHWMGLGAYPAVSLAEAREKAIEQRKLLAAGTDPLSTLAAKRVGSREIKFADAAERLIEAKATGGLRDRTVRQ